MLKRSVVIGSTILICLVASACDIDQEAFSRGISMGLESSASIQAGNYPIADSEGHLAEWHEKNDAKLFPEINLDNFRRNGHEPNNSTELYAEFCAGQTVSETDRIVCEKYYDDIGVKKPDHP